MNIKLYNDHETGQPHIFKHSVSEEEIFAFFSESAYFEYQRKDKSYEAFGKLSSGRFLQIAYRKEKYDLIFIITAYDIEDKEMINFIEDNI